VLPPTPAYHLRRARLLAQLGETAAASQERRRAEELRPASLIDSFLLGAEWFRQGDVKRAAGDFQEALRRQPDEFWSLFYLALCHLRLGEPDQANDLLAQCRARQPHFIWTYFLSALVHESLHAEDLAEEDYQAALDLHPNPAAACVLHVDRARLRFRRDHWGEAVDDLKRAIALKPDHFYTYLMLARVYQKMRDWEASEHQLAAALRLQPPAPYRAQCLLERGRNWYLAGKYPQAVQACATALRDHPMTPDLQLVHARSLVRLHRYDEAGESFERYLQVGGKPTAIFYRGRGQVRVQQQDYLGARDDYTHGLDLAPEDAELHAHRGWAYFFADAWKPALRDFEEAIRRDPAAAEPYCGRGLARVMLGQVREAVADAEEALRRGLDRPEMLVNAACIFALAAGKTDLADDAAHYRDRAVGALRFAVALLPVTERQPFWRDKVLPDTALESIRAYAGFKQLTDEVNRGR
jgi:tetratricopeptide (TPR) repeat protein